jgi:hypothetical protein
MGLDSEAAARSGRDTAASPPRDGSGAFFGLHIPKCAGTTLLRRVQSGLPGHSIHQTTSIRTGFLNGQPPFLALGRYDQLRFVFGHSVHEEMIKRLPRPPTVFTGMREPMARLRSSLGWRERMRRDGFKGPSLEEMAAKIRNPMCWFILQRFPTLAGREGSPAERAMNALRAFSFCYFTDTFEDWADLVFERLGIHPERVNHRVASEPPPDVKIDPNALAEDTELYARARDHFAQRPISARALAPTDRIARFHKEAERSDAVRSFWYEECLREYRGWSMLPEVAEQRARQAAELRMEADFLKASSAPKAS